ncbi:MAG: hypothetical protein LQ346_000463 [Caloplaca aetnensis]|nr:MAG: hypothetical protein LQ346_000463 [Caloplaca aetnensis]
MKTSSSFLALLASSAVIATPLSVPKYQKRGKSSIVKSILEIIGVATNTDANAWDYGGHPTMCSVNLSTKKGGNCHADVTCADGQKRDYDNWSACYHEGVNTFNDPGIGPFSVVYTKKDDDCGDGLCAPLLALEYVGNWFKFDVDALAAAAQDNANSATLCKVGCDAPTPASEPNSENICQRTNTYNNDGVISAQCGVPAVGKNYGPGELDSQGPTNEQGYAGPWCGVHVIQYQKKNPAGDPATDPEAQYHMDVKIFDHNEDPIGEVLGAEAKAGQAVGVTGKLPYVMLVTAQNVDEDPVLFAYADQSWAYADGE